MKKWLGPILVLIPALAGLLLFHPWRRGPQSSSGSRSATEARLCPAHGFPEDDCYQCKPELAEKFKTDLDWCHEHNLPESQCSLCDPYAKFKARGDWCKGHGVPESQCVKCNPALSASQPRFKDWCQEHQIAESQCTLCNPDLKTSLESDWCQEHNVRLSECVLCNPALRETDSGAIASGPAGEVQTPAEASHPTDSSQPSSSFCSHGFDKSTCFRCDPKLEARFKAAGDWCGGHGVPESQCLKCNPDVAAKVKQRLSVSTARPELLKSGTEGMEVSEAEDSASLPRSAFCGTHLLRIRFSRPDIARKIGLEVEPSRKRPLSETLQCNAEVAYDPGTLARVSSRLSGIVREMKVEVGQTVKAGEPLAVLESRELGEAKLEYLKTRKELAVAREVTARVERIAEQVRSLLKTIQPGVAGPELLRAWRQYEAGEARTRLSAALSAIERSRTEAATAQKLHQRLAPVVENTRKMLALLGEGGLSAKDAAGKLQALEVGEAKSALLEGLALVEVTRAELERQEKLLADKVGTQKDYQKAKSEYESAAAAYAARLEQSAISADRALTEAEAQVQKARQEVAAAEADFETLVQETSVGTETEFLKATKELELAESAARLAERRLRLFGLAGDELEGINSQGGEALALVAPRAPFEGTVIERSAAQGEVVEAGQALAVVADLSKMRLKLDVFEGDLPRLAAGQPVRFQPDGLRGESFEGTLVWLGSEVNDKTRTLNVQAELANTDGLLRANMFGRATVLIRQGQEAILVPKAAVQWEGCCHVVFIQLKDDLYAPRKVRLGHEGTDFYEVRAGLREGEPVVTQASFLLKTEILKSSIGAGCTD